MRVVGYGKHLFGSPFLGDAKEPWMDYPVFYCIVKANCDAQTGLPVTLTPEDWGIGPSNSQDKNDLIRKNADLIWSRLGAFPFPTPFNPGEGVFSFRKYLKSDLKDLANMDMELDADTIDIWITLEVMANYNSWVDIMEANAKAEAKRRKRIAIRNGVIEAIGAAVVSIAAPAAIMAIISAVHTATQAYIEIQKAKQAAAALKEAAAAFEKTDPEFAKLVQRTSDIFDILGAAGTEQGTVPPAATATEGSTAAPPEPAPGTKLAIGGGVIAAGLAAFAIFRK